MVSVMLLSAADKAVPVPVPEPMPEPAGDSMLVAASSVERRCAPACATGKRVAILFYGLSRNLGMTLPWFEKHVFNVLSRSEVHFDVFWSTVAIDGWHYTAADGESRPQHEQDVELMRPCFYEIHNQTKLLPLEWAKFCKARKMQCGPTSLVDSSQIVGGVPGKSYRTEKNLLPAFYTQVKGSEMIKRFSLAHNITYDALLVLRPDTAPLRDIDLVPKMFGAGLVGKEANSTANERLKPSGSGGETEAEQPLPVGRRQLRVRVNMNEASLPFNLAVADGIWGAGPHVTCEPLLESFLKRQPIAFVGIHSLSCKVAEEVHNTTTNTNAIWIPDFEHWNGCNDRAAFGVPYAMHTYLHRGLIFRDHPEDFPNYDSERFLLFFITHIHRLSVRRSDFRVVRVRHSGAVPRTDTDYVKMNMRRTEQPMRCIVNRRNASKSAFDCSNQH